MTLTQDTDETEVLFRADKFDGQVVAVFPYEAADAFGLTMSCYAHIGQHGACSISWYHMTRAARPEEYASLKRELESAPYGYRLKVIRRIRRRATQ